MTNDIQLKYDEKDLDLTTKDLGRILISALTEDMKKVGILSSVYIDMPLNSSAGYFGANATFINEKITITQISKGTAAAEFLKLKDEVTGIKVIPIRKSADYGAELAKYMVGDSITVDVVRDSNLLHIKILLSGYPVLRHVTNEFPGGRSLRSDGFKKVLVQDAAIKSDQCGGPVFGIDSTFYGINIARHSRTSTVVMSGSVLANFIDDVLNKRKPVGGGGI